MTEWLFGLAGVALIALADWLFGLAGVVLIILAGFVFGVLLQGKVKRRWPRRK